MPARTQLKLKITNLSKNSVLADQASMATSLFSRMKGLLGKDSLMPGEGLAISPCSSIHTFGMRFSIDAAFYDRDYRVIAVISGLRPYRASGWYPRARGVVELPAGTIRAALVSVGDELLFSSP